MVPGLDKLKKDYAEIDINENTNTPINPVIITNPDDINVSYINQYKREKRTDPFPLTYDERFSKITSKDIITTNPDDIDASYLNYPSKERGKRADTSPLTYKERLCKIVHKNIITILQNLKTREDVALYLNDTLKYNPMVKDINVSYDTFPPDTSKVRVSVSIALVDNTNICCDLSLYY